MRTLLAVLVALSIAASGCVDEEPESPSGASGEPVADQTNATLAPMVSKTDGAVAVGAGTPIASFQNGGTAHTFSVPDNATTIVVEVTWDSPVMDLDLALKEPGTEDPLVWQHQVQEGTPGAPDNPHGLRLDAPAQGEWQATVFPNGAAAQVAYTIWSTVFFGPVPEGYTAIA